MATKIVMTEELAKCAGKDKGNSSMRKGGRSKWNIDDFNAAVRAQAEAFPLCSKFPDIPPSHCGCLSCQKITA